MDPLESLLQKENVQLTERGLINGDTLRALFKGEGAYAGKTFFVTEHGDLFYTDKHEEELSVYQAVYDKRKGLIQDERTKIQNTNKETRGFSQRKHHHYDADATARALKKIYQLTGEPFTDDETRWFRRQLMELADESEATTVSEEGFTEALKAYVPGEGSLAPFGRDDSQRFVVRREVKREDGKLWDQPITGDDAERLQAAANAAERISLGENDKEALRRNIIEKYGFGRWAVTDERSIKSFLNKHDLGNGTQERTHLYDPQFNKGRTKQQFYLKSEPDLRVTLIKGEAKPSYERVPLDIEAVLGRERWADKMRGAFTDCKEKARAAYGSFKEDAKERWEKFRSGVRSAYVAGALIAGIALGGAGAHLGHRFHGTDHEREAPVATQPAQSSAAESLATGEEVAAQAQRPYERVVRPGDCLWRIAKEFSEEQTNKSVYEKTNEIARKNGKLTIPEYQEKRGRGEDVTKQEDPNLIYPGERVLIPRGAAQSSEEQSIDVVVQDEAASDDEKKGVVAGAAAGIAGVVGALAYRHRASPLRIVYAQVPAVRGAAAGPVDYVSVLEDLVRMKNEGASLKEMREKHDGFTDDREVRKAFNDYQAYVQAGTMRGEPIRRFDAGVVSEEYWNRMVHEYRHGQQSLRRLSEELGREYGMHVSSSTISRHARRALGVGSREEARTL
ncbi:hypothetical protein JXA12_00375 [Candidatus Woesearchaeota archaeon]|nr:hypothetical protein [Candidatus Woesearchaeota archaeon]